MSIFADEWRECMRAQFRHVVRTGDKLTEKSLIYVMQEVGFTEEELNQLRIQATIRAEDMPDDFVPDMQLPPAVSPAVEQHTESEFKPHPLECQCPRCVEANIIPHDEDGQPLPVDENEPPAEIYEQHPDPDGPQQLTLF